MERKDAFEVTHTLDGPL